jgi:hypothetical protein
MSISAPGEEQEEEAEEGDGEEDNEEEKDHSSAGDGAELVLYTDGGHELKAFATMDEEENADEEARNKKTTSGSSSSGTGKSRGKKKSCDRLDEDLMSVLPPSFGAGLEHSTFCAFMKKTPMGVGLQVQIIDKRIVVMGFKDGFDNINHIKQSDVIIAVNSIDAKGGNYMKVCALISHLLLSIHLPFSPSLSLLLPSLLLAVSLSHFLTYNQPPIRLCSSCWRRCDGKIHRRSRTLALCSR